MNHPEMIEGPEAAERFTMTPKSPTTPEGENSSAERLEPKDSEPTAPSSKSTNYSFQTVVTPGLAFQILGAQKPEE